MPGLVKKTINLSGHSTSVTLEEEFWQALALIISREGTSLRQLIQRIDAERIHQNSLYTLSSSIRVFVLNYLLESGKG